MRYDIFSLTYGYLSADFDMYEILNFLFDQYVFLGSDFHMYEIQSFLYFPGWESQWESKCRLPDIWNIIFSIP